MMNPQWLKSFATLAELGSFTDSAERLGITQAAVSQHIRHLELQLGPVILRSKRPLELTPAGSALLDYCQQIDRAHHHLMLRLSDAEATCGEVSVISPGSIGLRLYPLLLSLQEQHRDLTVRHRFAPDSEVIDAVLHNRYEMGLVTHKPDDKRLEAHPFAEEPLELIVPANTRVTGWNDLEKLGYIDHPDGQAMATRLLSRLFPGNPGIRNLPQRGFSNQIGLILEPVARGLGFAVLPRYARLEFTRPETIEVAAEGDALVDTIWLVHRAEWPLSARAQLALAWLQRHL